MNESDLANIPPDDPIDLLARPLFTVRAEDVSLVVSLSDLLARVGAGLPTELAYLMPHQQHAMHAFVVQLMAIVITRSGDARLERNEREWRDALRTIAGGAEAFQLVVRDLEKPAFLQPPVPEGSLAKFKEIEFADELDVLVLAKNHDVKAGRIRHPRIEHWVYALMSLQTQQGFSGRDNYGIARMNGGFGNRPGLGMAPSLGWAARVRRDVHAALESRQKLLSESYSYREDGLAFVWLSPWDGSKSLALGELDPFFIEICRRVRFSRESDGLRVQMTSTKVPRLESKERKGNTGDLWTPVDRERGAALTLPGTGFPYARISELLFDEDWIRPVALELRQEDGERPIAVARALVRGQGKTEGLHERVVPVPRRARGLLASVDGRAKLGALAKQRVEAVRVLRLKVLKPAICAFMQGGADELRLDDNRGDFLLDRLDDAVDAEFFPRLFEDIHSTPEDASARFEQWLVQLGRAALEAALVSLPTSAARRERAISAAEGRFFGGVRKNFSKVLGAKTHKNEEATQ